MSELIEGTILVVTDHTGDDEHGYVLTEASKRLLTATREIAGGDIVALALNSAPDVAALAAQGVTRIIAARLGRFSPRVPGIVADCVVAAARECDPEAILNVSNARGHDVAGQVAVLLGTGASVDVSSLRITQSRLLASKSVLDGQWETEFHVSGGVPVIALRTAGLVAADAPEPTTPEVEHLSVSFREASKAVAVKSSRTEDHTVSLTDAPVVVCGGRGTQGDFTLVNQLAERLGGAVGATRVATEEGWIDRAAQVGQSGVAIAPNLYIGLGISGDIHHVSGIRGAQTIVAVCDDAEAAIFELADFGVVGDINVVIPQALSALDGQ
ncbi:electron transfer flavoprotein subunit alpha/FixB family protein [Nanchangia anserum]|uniref:Electron transfer flavoprotein subunit alpha/FixB family protein n=1 Tax=Nanchangia anserum TaxID=2692125 RepID=A0A8I0GBU8_9ACTO|nr:electron transfer flavoprotein subunit alpha/FixB family protein [Nanchangia anserum]MBD3689908.1 electron transfer flavoprotein subunit alpha/FixB family protein [Nanchangia anserum]QOX82275.1 electron transfer flavoprotein subunit alpha/FixB family protein [Nanchangia anserum]